MSHPHRKRCKRYDIEGDAHYLTFSCFGRLPLLSRDRSRGWVLQALQLGREKGMYDLWAYVIMPEHVHVVLWPHQSIRVSAILTTMKQSAAKRALLWLHRHAPHYLVQLREIRPSGAHCYRFWQRGGGYDRNLRSVPDIYEKIEYTHANPVRRGLVATPAEWPWSSCRAWETGEDTPIPIDRHSLPAWMPEGP